MDQAVSTHVPLLRKTIFREPTEKDSQTPGVPYPGEVSNSMKLKFLPILIGGKAAYEKPQS